MNYLIFIFVTFVNGQVSYYEKLIAEKQNESLAYASHTSNEYFKGSNASQEIKNFGTYDFIIIGAGSAGCVIANRLSENRKWSVLILEAGESENDFTDIPAMLQYVSKSDHNWGYYSTPQLGACQGMKQRQCNVPRGKVLGGSSVLNALMYVRGNRRDYDKWAKDGNAGWSYKEVLPLFKKSEKSKINGNRGYHGKTGTLHVEYATPPSTLYKPFVEANQERGRKLVDYNGRKQIGVGRVQYNIVNGRRDSAYKAFLKPAQNRPNLKIVTKTLVLKINITKQVAEEVLFIHDGTMYRAAASEEIILSAGAINSPQLLMLSGIGPTDHLKELGIETVQNLPVGMNLQDHATFYGLTFCTNYTEPALNQSDYIRQYLKGEGPFTYAGNNHAIVFTLPNSGVPAIESILIPPNSTTPLTQYYLNLNDETTNEYLNKINPQTDFMLYMMLLHPKSRGTVRLTSDDPFQFPAVDLNILSDPDDIETMYNGITDMLKLRQTDAFKKYDVKLLPYHLPACKNYAYLTKRFWYCTIKQLTATIYHPVGTCKMGLKSDAVVDNKLKVHGIKGLRVADASIIPEITSGHIHAVAVMIGEKLSVLLKEEY